MSPRLKLAIIAMEDELPDLLREEVRKAGSLTALAARWGVSVALISQNLNPNSARPARRAIANRLGYERAYVYVGRRGVCHGS